VQHECDVKSML